MKKQIVNVGRRLSAADMKKTTGGIRVGTGSLRCGTPPPPPNCDVAYNGRCCTCCAGAAGDPCRIGREADPACWLI